jgi:3-ketoacyl-CoA synthase
VEGAPKLSLKVRSYLRFKAKVPSYKMAEAMDIVKRMWNRESLDSSDGPAPIVKNLQDFQENVAYYSLRLGYLNKAMFTWALTGLLIPLTFLWFWVALQSGETFINQLLGLKLSDVIEFVHRLSTISNFSILSGIVLVLIVTRKVARQRSVYCVDFVTYTPPDTMIVTTDKFKSIQREYETFTPDSLAFMDKLVDRTGLGEKTYFPPGTLASPPDLSWQTHGLKLNLSFLDAWINFLRLRV